MAAVEGFESWAIVEVMGHNVYAGFASETSICGQSFLRVDVPATEHQPAFTKLLGGGSIFCLTPCDEATARAAVVSRNVQPFDYYTMQRDTHAGQQRLAVEAEADDEDDDEQYEDGSY